VAVVRFFGEQNGSRTEFCPSFFPIFFPKIKNLRENVEKKSQNSLLSLHYNNGYAKASQCYIVNSLLILLSVKLGGTIHIVIITVEMANCKLYAQNTKKKSL